MAWRGVTWRGVAWRGGVERGDMERGGVERGGVEIGVVEGVPLSCRPRRGWDRGGSSRTPPRSAPRGTSDSRSSTGPETMAAQ